MNYKTMILVGASALSFALSGCINLARYDGAIIDKRHEPERIYERVEMVSGGRMPSSAYKKIMVDDEDYVLVVGRELKNMKGEKELRTWELYVAKDVYDSLNIGDFFDGSLPYETDDRDYEAKR